MQDNTPPGMKFKADCLQDQGRAHTAQTKHRTTSNTMTPVGGSHVEVFQQTRRSALALDLLVVEQSHLGNSL